MKKIPPFMKKVLWNVLKEFWLPFVAALAWTVFSICSMDSDDRSLVKIVGIFGSAFFLISWINGQFFRIKKQAKTEDSFETIETRLKTLTAGIEAETEKLVGFATGGNSFPKLAFSSIDHGKNTCMLILSNEGKYPLYDIQVRIVVRSGDPVGDIFRPPQPLAAGSAVPLGTWSFNEEQKLSYNIFISARNGHFIQYVRLFKTESQWVVRFRVMDSSGNVLLEKKDTEYPESESGEW